jgi:hypothetical protein
MAIVMGLDQHRAQITAEWMDTDTGEIGRARLSPAVRADVRKFLKRFCGQRLEVALEATTGWRFVAEELRAAGAEVHLAEPAETAARRGNKKRAKTDRGDARHLRELLMIGRLPESWIAPDHLLDLRAQVRLRHTLVDQRGEWQQRIQAVLYHHGFPQRNGLLTAENRAWLEALELPPGAHELVTVALRMIDALDAQSAPITQQLRLYARRQTGCKALMKHLRPGRRPPRGQPRLPRVGPQAVEEELPHAARARRRRPAARLTSFGARQVLHHPRCTAASSPHAAAATCGWTASKDRAAATRLTRRPHHPSCRRPRTGRGPR